MIDLCIHPDDLLYLQDRCWARSGGPGGSAERFCRSGSFDSGASHSQTVLLLENQEEESQLFCSIALASHLSEEARFCSVLRWKGAPSFSDSSKHLMHFQNFPQFSLVLELQAHKDSFHLRPELWEALGAFQERHVHRVLFGFAGMLSGLQSMLYQT